MVKLDRLAGWREHGAVSERGARIWVRGTAAWPVVLLMSFAFVAPFISNIAETRSDEVEQASATEKSASPAEHPLVAPLNLARESMVAVEAVNDYEAIFSKRELVNNQMVSHRIQVKHRFEPFSVYLQFQDPHQGREVLYVEGKNDGNLLAHEAGLLGLVGTLSLAPTSAQAMSESKNPITSIGIKNLLRGVIKQWEAETKFGETTVKYYKDAKLQDIECIAIESTHPVPRREFYCHITRLYLDKKNKLPVRVERFGWPAQQNAKPPLLEEYTYSRLRPNVGLKDIDFDPKNPKYSF